MTAATLAHILYVEDDTDVQTVAQLSLEVVGKFNLKICGSGADAVAEIRAGYVPDLLLLDVMMPNMDGPTTLAELRKLKSTESTPVVFMTAKVQATEMEYYKSLGAIGVIAKPFDPMDLANQVRCLWERRA